MTALTPQAIAGQIAACDATIAALAGEAQRLALAATEGNAAAATRLASINAEIEATRGDRFILTQAQRAAEARALVADEAQQSRRREEHLIAAKAAGGRVVQAAEAIDAAIAAYTVAAEALAEAEADARTHARLAGDDLGSRAGRKGAVAHGAFLLARIVDGSARRRNDRSVTDVVSAAWAEYLQCPEGAENAA